MKRVHLAASQGIAWKTMSIAVIWFLLLHGLCIAETRYVQIDHPDADDAGPGSEGQPWKHCPGMPGWNGTAVLQPGDLLLFNNASVWEISGDSIIQAEGGVTYDGRSWGPGTRAILRAVGDLNRTVINFMEDDPDHPTVVRGFELDVNNRVTSGIGVNWPQMTRSLTGAVKRIEDCIVYDVFSRESLNQFEYGITVGGWHEKSIKNVEILDCTVFNISRTGIAVYPGNDLPGNLVENVLVRGCEVYHTGTDPDAPGSGFGMGMKNHGLNVVFEYNYIHDTMISGVAVTTNPEPGFRGPENAVIRHNIIRDCGQCGIFIQELGDKSVDIYGNLLINNYCEGIRLASSLRDRLSIRIFNNTFYHNYKLDWSQELRIESSDAVIDVLEVSNNIFHASAKTRCLVDDDGDITAHDHNDYFRKKGALLVISAGKEYTADNIVVWESTALNTDPLFIDADSPPDGFTGTHGIDLRPATEGFNISMFSPVKDKGIMLDARFNGSINSIPRPSGPGWEIGAYEFRDESGNYLSLNQEVFRPDDRFHLQKMAVNSESHSVIVCDFVVLDLQGAYYFWPGWTSGIDCVFGMLAPGSADNLDILNFIWPHDAGKGSGVQIHAGFIDPVSLSPYGAFTSVVFDYYP